MPDTLVPERVTEGAEPSVALSSRQSTAFWCGLCSPMSCLPQRLTRPPGLHVPLSLGGLRVAPPQPRGPWVALPDLGRSREPAVTGAGDTPRPWWSADLSSLLEGPAGASQDRLVPGSSCAALPPRLGDFCSGGFGFRAHALRQESGPRLRLRAPARVVRAACGFRSQAPAPARRAPAAPLSYEGSAPHCRLLLFSLVTPR